MKTQYLLNPFTRIAGWKSLALGLSAMTLTAILGKLNRVAFDGALDIHAGATFSLSASLAMQALDFLALFLTMWLAGFIFSKSKLRAVDIAGTIALSRAPLLLLVIIAFLPIIPEGLYDIPRMIIFSLICIPFTVWVIALMYNAYSVSCHLNGSRAVGSFVGALLLSEIASKLLFIFLLSSIFFSNPITCASEATSTDSIIASDSLTIRQKTENIAKSFEQGNLEAITVYFDKNMTEKLPVNLIKITWLQISFTCGKLEKADIFGVTESKVNDLDIVEVPLIFAKAERKLRVTFNSNGQVSGLWIH